MFCIEDETDPAIEVVNSLIEKYPKVAAHVFIGGSVVGVNPKINNMNRAYEASNYDLILISDSGIRSKMLFFYYKIPYFKSIIYLISVSFYKVPSITKYLPSYQFVDLIYNSYYSHISLKYLHNTKNPCLLYKKLSYISSFT